MPQPVPDQPDPRKVRIGLGIVAVVVVVAVVLSLVIESPVGRGLMLLIAGFAIVRMFLLTRSVRRGTGDA